MASRTPITAASNSKRGRTIALILLLFVAAATLVSRWLLGRTPDHDPMHGDSEEAGAALYDVMRPMKEGDKLPFLLRSVHDASAGLRYAAVDGLAAYSTKEAADAIEEAFRDSSSVVRQRAVETLHVVNRERGMRLLFAALQDEDTWIRQAAISQLATPRNAGSPSAAGAAVKPAAAKPTDSDTVLVTPLADRRAVPLLVRALDDKDDLVALYAVKLLHRVTGQGTIYKVKDGPAARARSIAAWKSWWASNALKYPLAPELANIAQINPTRTDPAPGFDLRDTDGHPVNLSAQRGHVVLLNFWGTWCPPCKLETPDLQRLHAAYNERGVVVVGAALAEPKGITGLRAWCAEHGLTYRQALSTPELQEAYGHIEEVPVSVMIDKKGLIRYRWEGERDYATFQAAADRLLAE